MPTVTCYGGAAEIGGNKVLLEDGNTRIFFDFGIPFGRHGQYFNEMLRPRAARGLLDPLALGLIPPLERLYREDLALPGLWDRFRRSPHYRDLSRSDAPAVDAVLVSHAHLDHNGDVSYLDPSIPIYSMRLSAFIARTMQVTGQQTADREMVVLNERACNESGELASARSKTCQARVYCFVDGDLSPKAAGLWSESPAVTKSLVKPVIRPFAGSAGGARVQWWPVDHSLPGAAGYAVETSAGWVGYTGDIRFHGSQGASTRRLAEGLAALRPAALLCEGTHLSVTVPVTEADIVVRALPLAEAAGGRLVVADFGPRNVERLLSFLTIASRTGRTLLGQPKDIYLLRSMALADPAYRDPLSIEGLGVYADPKVSRKAWERAVLDDWRGRVVGPREVSSTPGQYILAWSLWDLNDLLDLEGIQGGVYLYSNSKAYDEEQAADLERLRNWVRFMGLTLHGDPDDPDAILLHSSGHASGPDLVQFVKQVRPKTLIPIHTEHPERWAEQLAGTGIAVCPPEVGCSIQVR